jgi:ABC-type multidrug transport system fused ATPase/permease subunit
MLNTLFEKLEKFFSPRFVIASFFPVLLAVAVNAALLAAVSPAFRAYATTIPTDKSAAAFEFVLVTLVLLVMIFILSASAGVLRDLMEGRHWNQKVSESFARRHRDALDQLNADIEASNQARATWHRIDAMLEREVEPARAAGRKTESVRNFFSEQVALDEEERKRRKGDPADLDQLAKIADAFIVLLRSNDMSVPGAKTYNDMYLRFKRVLEWEGNRLDTRADELWNAREFNYGLDVVAPTRVGNIARSIPSYARGRYGMNLDVFWTRLQKVMQPDSAHYSSVLDAKAQLDFFITSFYLVNASFLVWLFVLPFVSDSVLLYAGLVIAAPLIAGLLYRGCVMSYHGFADLVRSSVDHYRFKLLEALHVRFPQTLEQEQRLWNTLGQLAGYGSKRYLEYQKVAPT